LTPTGSRGIYVRTCRHKEDTVVGKRRWIGLLAISLLVAVGCKSSIGAKTVTRDQFNYAEALREAWKEQMLLNMVGLRYAEAPTFLKVTSVINQYSLEGSVSAAAPPYDLQAAAAPPLGISGRFSDRPTITYMPLSGAEFTRSVLTPIPPHTIMSLIQAGWRADLLIRLTVRAINGVAAAASMGNEAGDSRFLELVRLMGKIQTAGGLSFRIEKRGKDDVAIVMIRGESSAEIQRDRARIVEILGIDPNLGEYHLVFGRQASAPNEIAMLTRSIIEMLVDLSLWIEVPPEHEASGRTRPTLDRESLEAYGFKPLIRVRSSTDAPESAFVAVRYEGIWFWIDHEDFGSKRTLSFMQLMFSLAESGGGQTAPVVTVQAGGG
jgi:hypothetical protein